MTDIIAQASFNSGEWSPKLNARVDLAKYKSGAALLENFFIDYRGGVSTRTGTKYIIQAYRSSTQVRIITFAVSFNVQYVLEFGNGYIRFFYQGAPIVENGFAISGATQANPCVLTISGNNYNIGDWIFVQNVAGMTQLNGRYFSVLGKSGSSVTLGDLNGNALNSSAYSAYTSGGTASRIYTITSPYTSADDLRLIKFVQNVSQMILCHPNHPVQVLTIVSATNWTIIPATIGATVSPPTGLSISTTLGAGSVNYAYGVTSIDSNGQESAMSAVGTLTSKLDLRTTPGSNSVSWSAASGAVAYNVYEATVSYFGAVPSGVQYGFIGTTKGLSFIDSNIGADFSQTPPVSKNPFAGAGISSISMTTVGSGYLTPPTVITSGGSPSVVATLQAVLGAAPGSLVVEFPSGSGYNVGDTATFANGVTIIITAVSGGVPTAGTISNPGSVTGAVPTNPLTQISTSGTGTGLLIDIGTWGVTSVLINDSGAGYASTPSIVFSGGSGSGAAATATVAPPALGFPTVPGMVQQRLVLAATPSNPQTFYMSKSGQPFNFDISRPTQASDSITSTLVSNTLNNIKAIVGSASGMLILTDKASWLVNGGTAGSAITPTSIVANPQSFIGASDVPPIVANYDVLYVQSKGSAVRDLAFNIYFSVFTGTDISTLSSHLFYGHTIVEWAWAEQPYYIVQAIRDDGWLLSLTFLKEQDFIGWTHFVTTGAFVSVTSATEVTSTAGTVDAVYVVTSRVVNGSVLKYIERFAERSFTNGVADAWCVDAGLQYSGTAKTSFTGAEHLAGLTVTGLADGQVIPPFVMPSNGQFTLGTAASKVTVGLGFTCKLQTLAIDTGEPSIQGKLKKINSVTVRVSETLGLNIGTSFSNQIPMKDLIRGNVASTLVGLGSQVVTDLVTGDAETNIDPSFNIYGQYCLTQTQPLPASVLGVFPAISQGDPR